MKKIQHLPSKNGGTMSNDKPTAQNVVLSKNQMTTIKGGMTKSSIIGDDLIII